MARTFDTIVVGNSSLGMTLARELAHADPNMRIAVIGPANRKGSASLVAAAMINLWAELEADAFKDPALSTRFSIPRRSFDMWAAHAQALEAESGLPVSVNWGTYVINSARGYRGEDRSFDYMLTQLREQNIPHEFPALSDLPFLATANDARPLRVVKVPDGRVDSRQVIAALEKILQNLSNCEVIDAAAVGLSVNSNGEKVIRLNQGEELHTRTVVMASGSYSQILVDQIADLKASVPRIMFGGGSGLDISFPAWAHASEAFPGPLRELNHVVRTMDRGGACGLHLVPYGDGTYFFGASSGVWAESEEAPRVHAISWLLNGLKSEINHAFFHANVTLRGPGFRPVSMDAYPLLGESAVSGIWFLNGMKRDGFTCAPFLAREMVKAMAGQPSELPEIFRPSRPLISYRRKEYAITAAVNAAIGGELMHGMVIVPYRIDEWAQHHRQKIEQIYERRGLDGFGIHPELIHFYESDTLFALTKHSRERA